MKKLVVLMIIGIALPCDGMGDFEKPITNLSKNILVQNPNLKPDSDNLKTVLENYATKFSWKAGQGDLSAVVRQLSDFIDNMQTTYAQRCESQYNIFLIIRSLLPSMKNLLEAWDSNDFLKTSKQDYASTYKIAYKLYITSAFMSNTRPDEITGTLKLSKELKSPQFKDINQATINKEQVDITRAFNELKSLKDFFANYCALLKEYDARIWQTNKTYWENVSEDEKGKIWGDLDEFGDNPVTIIKTYIDKKLIPIYGPDPNKTSQNLQQLFGGLDVLAKLNGIITNEYRETPYHAGTTKELEEERVKKEQETYEKYLENIKQTFQKSVFKTEEDFKADLTTLTDTIANASDLSPDNKAKINATIQQFPENRTIVRSLTLSVDAINNRAKDYMQFITELKQKDKSGPMEVSIAQGKVTAAFENLKTALKDHLEKTIPNAIQLATDLAGAKTLAQRQAEDYKTALEIFDLDFSKKPNFPSPQDQTHKKLVDTYITLANNLDGYLKDPTIEVLPADNLKLTMLKAKQQVLNQIISWVGAGNNLLDKYDDFLAQRKIQQQLKTSEELLKDLNDLNINLSALATKI